MASDRRDNDVTVALTGLEMKSQLGRVAANTLTRTGERKNGKHRLEEWRGNEFSSSGSMVSKDRIIDRQNNSYREKVVNVDTGEVLKDVSHPLTEHTGHGSDKAKQNDR